MLEGVTELSQTSVKEVLVPRIDVVFLPADAALDEVLKILERDGYSRYPVYEETIDNVIGVFYVKDLIPVILNHRDDFDLKKLIRKPYFVPESKRLDSLLAEFKKRHVHIAIAVDEHGGVSGIVCMEDIIEEIVGEIQDEFDEKLLRSLAEITGGSYFHAADADGMKQVMDQINQLEKTTIEQPKYIEFREYAPRLALVALGLLLLGFIADTTWCMRLP